LFFDLFVKIILKKGGVQEDYYIQIKEMQTKRKREREVFVAKYFKFC